MALQSQTLGAKVKVGSTGNFPELVEKIPITEPDRPRDWRVVMSLGPRSETDSPMPDLKPGDLVEVFVEVEVTTDAAEASNPGLIGLAYDYDPNIEARLLLAAGSRTTAAEKGRAVSIGKGWQGTCTQAKHHEVIVLAGKQLTVPRQGLGWSGANFVNVVLSATSPKAKRGNVLLIGENEPTKTVDQNTGGIRVVRFRPASQIKTASSKVSKPLVGAVRVAKKPTVIFSVPLKDLKKDEQLLVRGRLVADGGDVGYTARLSSTLYLATSSKELEPGGQAQEIASWKGNISKENGFNCVKGSGPAAQDKFGVLRISKDARNTAYVNLAATSAAPTLPNSTPGDLLPIRDGSFLEVIRYPPERFG